jgi:tRNA(Ile)-lysidine synthetase-like protein
MSSLRKIVAKKINKALLEFNMIEPGDHILLALSGGKDSLLLLEQLKNRLSQFPGSRITAAWIKSELSSPDTEVFLTELCKKWSIPLVIKEIKVFKRLKPGKQMNCYWCSMQRRGELIQICQDLQCSKLALGHHMDDIVETLMMNLLNKGVYEGMPPLLQYHKYPLCLIRPLMYLEEKEIIQAIQQLKLSTFTCTCNYNSNSRRKEIRDKISYLTENRSSEKHNMLKYALKTGWNGLYNSFKE